VIAQRCPQPPRCRPGPPEFEISCFSVTIIGFSFSKISTGVLEILAGKPMTLMPSLVGRAPRPPFMKMMSAKRFPY
jgi:hypothetical protein